MLGARRIRRSLSRGRWRSVGDDRPVAVPEQVRHDPDGDTAGYLAGPPEDFDFVAAMGFNLLTSLGMRAEHRLLDIGCGQLRIGRLLIQYLDRGNYVGVDPNSGSIDIGLRRYVGRHLINVKRPLLIDSANPGAVPDEPKFDFAIAQSVFSHTGPDLLEGWLAAASRVLDSGGVLAATWVPGADRAEDGWTSAFVTYSETTLGRMAAEHGLSFHSIEWRHRNQRWALFGAPGYDGSWFGDLPSWNAMAERRYGLPSYKALEATSTGERSDTSIEEDETGER